MTTTTNEAIQAAQREGLAVHRWRTHVNPATHCALAINWLDLGITPHGDGRMTDIRGNTIAWSEVLEIDETDADHVRAAERWFYGE